MRTVIETQKTSRISSDGFTPRFTGASAPISTQAAEVAQKAQSSFCVLAGLAVKLLVDIFQVGVSDVGVNLGGGDVAVTEHALDAA